MLSKVKLYGDLAEFVGHKQFDVKVNSVAQAVSFLINNFPQTEAYMSNRYYKVLVNEYEIDDTQIHEPTGKQEISFVPVISGAGGNTGRLLLGAALIGIAIVNPFGAASIGTFTNNDRYFGAVCKNAVLTSADSRFQCRTLASNNSICLANLVPVGLLLSNFPANASGSL